MLKEISTDDRDLAELATQAATMAAGVRKLVEEKEALLWGAVRACGGTVTIPAQYLESLPEKRETRYDPFSHSVVLTIGEE